MNLKDCIDLFDDASAFTFSVATADGQSVAVKFLDDSGLTSSGCDSFFVAGHEFGPHVLIHARSFESAWETWIDESATIDESELPEAYGVTDGPFADAYRKEHPLPSGAGDAFQAWHGAFTAACLAELRRSGAAADAGEGDYPELVEGYEMQSNASGTGIVDVGHHAWMNEVDPADVTIERKEAT